MAINMRRIACELKQYSPQLFINNRKNEKITTIIQIDDKLPPEAVNDCLYIIKDGLPKDSMRFTSPINILCICNGDMLSGLSKDVMVNLILITEFDVGSLEALLQNILLNCSSEGYIPQQLLEAVCSGGMQRIADIGYSLLGNPIIIYDLSFKILVYSKNINPECEIFNKVTQDEHMIEQTMTAFYQCNVLNMLRENRAAFFYKCPDIENPALPNNTVLIKCPICKNGLLIGFAVVMKAYVEWDDDDLILTDEICKIFSIEMRNSDFYINSTGTLPQQFLSDMLENSTSNKEFVQTKIKALNLKLNRHLYIVAVKFNSQTKLQIHLSVIQKELEYILKSIVSTIYQDFIVILIHHNNANLILSNSVQGKLSALLATYDMVAGISMPFSDPCQIQRHFQQTVDAIKLGLSLNKTEKIFFFQQLYIYHLFELSSRTTDIYDFFHPAIFCLMKYDKENHTEFLKTLYYYIFNLKGLLRTKNVIHIHRNTLVYRINKIKEIANIDINDGETFFHLYITFKGLKYIEQRENKKIDFL